MTTTEVVRVGSGPSTKDRAQAMLDAAEVVWWQWGDLGLTVRRVVAAGPKASGQVLTTQTVYTYFGGVDAVITAMTDRAVTALLELTEDRLDPTLWRTYARKRPARWHMAATGRTPKDAPAAGLASVIERCRDALGGPAGFAVLNGVISAELHGQLSTDEANTIISSSSLTVSRAF